MGVISVLCNHLSSPLCDVPRPAQRCLVVLVLCAAVQRNEGGLPTDESKSPGLYLMCAVTSVGHSAQNAAVQVVRARGRSGPAICSEKLKRRLRCWPCTCCGVEVGFMMTLMFVGFSFSTQKLNPAEHS